MKRFFTTVLIAIAVFLMHACTNHKADLPQPINQTNTLVSYKNDIHPLIVTYCYGQGTQTCHVTPSNQGSNGDFTTYAGLYAKVQNGSLKVRVFQTNGGMPPSYSSGPTSLTPQDLAKFKTWVLTEGAPNN
ncbi:MAG: hypothetical protein ABI199_10780 [Bacteroidia bacterium]